MVSALNSKTRDNRNFRKTEKKCLEGGSFDELATRPGGGDNTPSRFIPPGIETGIKSQLAEPLTKQHECTLVDNYHNSHHLPG